MGSLSKIWLFLVGLLAACATSGSAVPERVETPEVVASWEEGCQDEHSLVLLCREDGEECGFFRCREVEAGDEVLLASRGGGPIYIPGPSPMSRGWRSRPIGWPRASRPVLTFRFNRHFDFPQAEGLARWFQRQGVRDIHQFTLLIPEHVHIRLHSRGPRGGLWNMAWQQFKDANPNAPPEAIYRHAGELMFRFELTGTVVPYSRGGR